jgi:hypothetical protein
MARSGLLVGLTLVSVGAVAEDVPSVGILHNTSEDQSLNYACDLNGAVLSCKFSQVSVRRKATQDERDKVQARIREEFPSYKPMGKQECDKFREMVEIAEGRKPAPKPQALAKSPPFERRDISSLGRAFIGVCEKHSLESYQNLAMVGLDKDMRTCRISSHTFEQRFRRVVDPASGVETWVVDSKPEGPCGIVQLSRFEVAPDMKLKFWNYVARKAITNPAATLPLGGNCSDLDEAQYVYAWQERDHALGCDYIEFSPL